MKREFLSLARLLLIMAVGLFVIGFFNLANRYSPARAQQQPDVKASPTPIVAKPDKPDKASDKKTEPSLALTPEEQKQWPPLWGELQTRRADFAQAQENAEDALKNPLDVKAHSQALFAFSATRKQFMMANNKWNDWYAALQEKHGCQSCDFNIQKGEFIKFPTEKNTAPPK